jgi:DNA polymerase-3 subunit gamma/tau
MSYQVLARKWRPKSFETLVGQDHVVRALTNALEQNRLHHAYLFTGTRGVGKTTLARILAKSLNCETGITPTPCGICNTCTEIDRGRYVDLIEVDAASNTQVDAMRDLLDNAQYAPTSGRFKVYIIDEVHMLSKSAFNAMLKTLEEPPAHVKFILATTDPQKVPVTVLSRCLQFNLRQMASTSIIDHLENILGQENIAFEVSALNLIARAAQGSMRDALSLTDQAIAYGGQTINENEVRTMLGAIDQRYLFVLLEAIQNQDGDALINQAKLMEERSISFEVALNDLALLLHLISMTQAVPNSVALDHPDRTTLLQFAQSISAELLQLYYQIVILAKRDLHLAPDEYAGFTMCLLRMLTFTPNLKSSKQAIHSTVVNNITIPFQADHSESQHTSIATPLPRLETHQEAKQKINQTDENNQTATNKSPTKSSHFDGNWRGLIDQLKLGIVTSLAQNCELIEYDEHHIQLSVTDSNKHLLMPQYQEKLTNIICQHFNQKIKLQFSIGGTGNTPAKQILEEKIEVQFGAEQSIEQDTFVQALIRDFDAKIIENSIKPL